MLGKLDIIEEKGKIVTLIKFQNKYQWFVSDKEYWVIDRNIWKQNYIKAGYDVNVNDHSSRFDIGVLNEKTYAEFINCLEKEGDGVSQQELIDEFFLRLEITDDWWDFSELLPVLYIDFDNQILYEEGLVESIDYKQYLPDGWKSYKDNYFENIPESLKFWIKDGIDYLKKLA